MELYEAAVEEELLGDGADDRVEHTGKRRRMQDTHIFPLK